MAGRGGTCNFACHTGIRRSSPAKKTVRRAGAAEATIVSPAATYGVTADRLYLTTSPTAKKGFSGLKSRLAALPIGFVAHVWQVSAQAGPVRARPKATGGGPTRRTLRQRRVIGRHTVRVLAESRQ